MNNFSAKTVALTALIAWGALMSGSAHAAILRSSNGMPVLTKDGTCVTTNWEGGEGCEAAKLGVASADAYEHDMEKTVYFDFNKSTLTADAKRRLDHLATKLEGKMGKHHHHHHHHHHDDIGHTITVVGFADRPEGHRT